MKIGFDLDGVVLEQDMAILRMIDLADEKKQEELAHYYCNKRTMQLNPIDYLADGDDLFFITGRSIWNEAITIQWAKKYFPMATVIVTRVAHPKNDTVIMCSNYGKDDSWNRLQAERKSDVIHANGIDVYFEDNPEVVKILRKLNPNTKVIQYGGRCF
jgi:hypothetical protein